MKKLLLLSLVLSSMGLFGCTDKQKTSDVSFQYLNFGKEITGEKKERIISNVNHNFGFLKSYSSSTNIYLNTQGSEISSKINNKVTIYDRNHIHAEFITERTETGLGEDIKSSVHGVYDRFDNYARTVVELTTRDDEVTSYNVSELDLSISQSELIGSYVRHTIADYTSKDFTLYKDGKNYAFAISHIDETTSERQTKDGVKEYYQKIRTQEVFSIDSNYVITSYYSFEDKVNNGYNKDGKWEEKATLTSLYTVNATFNFTLRDSVFPSGEEIKDKVRDYFKNGYFEELTLESSLDDLSFNSMPKVFKPDYVEITSPIRVSRPAGVPKDADITFKLSVGVTYYEDLSSFEEKTQTLDLTPIVEEGSGLQVQGTTVTIPGGKIIEEITMNLMIGLNLGQPFIKSVTIKSVTIN